MKKRAKSQKKNLKSYAYGVSKSLAMSCGALGQRYRRSAKMQGIHAALGNEFFERLGLISLGDRWVGIHYMDREPPIADSHNGWYGGWERETPSDPIR